MVKKLLFGNNKKEVYAVKKRQNISKEKKIAIIATVAMIVWVILFYMYITYNKIEIKT